MRICSFLPSTTEIVCALGLEENLVGITHECDYPPEVRSKPITIKSRLDTKKLSSEKIDQYVSDKAKKGKSIYMVDLEELKKAAPDIIFTQDLCEVCAVSGDEVVQASEVLSKSPEVISIAPGSIKDILESITEIGKATNTNEKAIHIVDGLQKRIDYIQEKLSRERDRPRVFCLEWLAPPFVAGHWIPEMVEIAGGINGIGEKGKVSTKVSWDEILEFAPNYMLVMPCGFDIDRTINEIDKAISAEQWHQLPSSRNGHTYLLDANSYFSRPSPRIVNGLEIISGILHPQIFKKEFPVNSVLNLRNYFRMQSFLG